MRISILCGVLAAAMLLGGTPSGNALIATRPVVLHQGGHVVLVSDDELLNSGNVAVVYYPGGRFERVAANRWVEAGDNGARFDFIETGFDETAVYLRDPSRNVQIALDVSLKVVLYAEGDGEFRKLYTITHAERGARSGGETVDDARWQTCEALSGVQSQRSDTAVDVTFINASEGQRGVMWIDFGGAPVHYATLAPGESFAIQTYVTHPWMFTDGPGNCIEMFMPRRGVSVFEITAPNRDFGDE